MCRAHLIERDEPFDNLAFAVKLDIGDLVHRLYDVDEEGMQHVFGSHAYLNSIEQRDEVLGRLYNQECACFGPLRHDLL